MYRRDWGTRAHLDAHFEPWIWIDFDLATEVPLDQCLSYASYRGSWVTRPHHRGDWEFGQSSSAARTVWKSRMVPMFHVCEWDYHGLLRSATCCL